MIWYCYFVNLNLLDVQVFKTGKQLNFRSDLLKVDFVQLSTRRHWRLSNLSWFPVDVCIFDWHSGSKLWMNPVPHGWSSSFHYLRSRTHEIDTITAVHAAQFSNIPKFKQYWGLDFTGFLYELHIEDNLIVIRVTITEQRIRHKLLQFQCREK